VRGTILSYRPESIEPSIRNVVGPPTLEDLKAAIGGGYIEAVPYFWTVDHRGVEHRCVAFCDEEGKLKGMPVNPFATALWDLAIRRVKGVGCEPDFLVGRIAVVFGDPEFMEEL
jgi:hypothetical protein